MKRLFLCATLILGLSACGGGSSGGGAGDDDGGDDGGLPTDFTAFVKDQLAKTSDTTDPVDINGLVFENVDNQDPTAFDDVLGN